MKESLLKYKLQSAPITESILQALKFTRFMISPHFMLSPLQIDFILTDLLLTPHCYVHVYIGIEGHCLSGKNETMARTVTSQLFPVLDQRQENTQKAHATYHVKLVHFVLLTRWQPLVNQPNANLLHVYFVDLCHSVCYLMDICMKRTKLPP